MKILRILLLCFISSTSMLNTKAQTADEIINKWTDAMGGRQKLGSIKTVYSENEMSIMNNPAPNKTYLINGKGYKTETDFNGQKIIDCYLPNSGWSINPLAGQSAATVMPAAQVKLGQLNLDPAGPLYNYAAKGSKTVLLGKDDVNGISAYKINLTTATGTQIIFFIDSASSYILKEITKLTVEGQDLEITTAFSDYRKIDGGFVMPNSIEVSLPQLSFTITSKKTEINKDIDPAIFEMPKN